MAGAFEELYWRYLPQALAETEGELLPGVSELLESLSQRADVALGLLTGNAHVPAYHKLKHFQVDRYFEFGGFGDREVCRNEVAALAKNASQDYLGAKFSENQVWVIGDTVKDIECGRSIGAKVVAVETGGGSRAELATAKPEIQVADFRNPSELIRSCFG